ncbi:MAG TPA: hypothetical protein VEL76_02960, partial [Gemmataceae bacterium]|nr:hypothetical protein [Gemmataceae bacterium]
MKASPLPLWLAGLGCLLGVLVAWTSLPAAQIGGKMPVPDTAAQTAAEALVKRILGDDYKRVGADAAAVEKWILTLRQQAADTKEEAVRFVLLREARDLAARVGDVVTALRVVGELAEEYAIDEPAMSADVLRLAAPAAKTLRMKQTLARAALDLLNRFLDADNPDAALSVAPTAEAAAAASDSLRLEVATRLQEARLLQKERGR